MYKHILAALDGSPRAPRVLREAAELAARTGATLHLCRAVTVPHGMPTDAFFYTGEVLEARLVEHGLRELGALVEGLHPTHTPIVWGQRVCRLGTPGQLVVDLAAELGADLVVLGSHGYGLIDRLLGTTAARIVNHAPCNVLVVRERPAAAQQA
ncbi:MAG: universal stress protein [Myxococcales bacterium]|nr:universal stress protein [Myxococcales bacterium]